MPSAWLEKKRNKHGINYLLRWEWQEPDPSDPNKTITLRDSKACGPSKPYANEQEELKRRELIEGAPATQPGQQHLKTAMEAYLKDARTYKNAKTTDNFDEPALNLLLQFAGNRLMADFRGNELQGRIVVRERAGTTLIRNWKIWLMQECEHARGIGYKPNGARIWMTAARTFFNYFGIHPNPFDQVEMPSKEEVGTLITDAQAREIPKLIPWRVARAMVFDLLTGLRREELLSLDWSKVNYFYDTEKNLLSGTIEVKGKGGRSRVIELVPAAIAVLGPKQEYGLVFNGVTKDMLKHYTKKLADHWSPAGREHKMRLRFHDFRHNWATRAAKRLGLADWMGKGGWKSITSARGYLHYFEGPREETALDYGFSPTIPPLKEPINPKVIDLQLVAPS